MFVERLSKKQVQGLAELLAKQHEEMDLEDWSIKRWKTLDGKAWVIQLHCKNNDAYTIEMRLNDYDVYLWESGLLFRGWIIKKYVQFMYHTFGEEYKRAYLTNAAEIFKEE